MIKRKKSHFPGCGGCITALYVPASLPGRWEDGLFPAVDTGGMPIWNTENVSVACAGELWHCRNGWCVRIEFYYRWSDRRCGGNLPVSVCSILFITDSVWHDYRQRKNQCSIKLPDKSSGSANCRQSHLYLEALYIVRINMQCFIFKSISAIIE